MKTVTYQLTTRRGSFAVTVGYPERGKIKDPIQLSGTAPKFRFYAGQSFLARLIKLFWWGEFIWCEPIE